MAETAMEKVAAAKARVPQVSPEEAAELQKQDALIVDVRDSEEVAKSGKVPGAVNVSRGMLEFRADETTPYHNPEFRKDRTIVLYCASGGRSALAGQSLLEMGYSDVRNLGGFKDWAEKGLPTESA